MKRKTTARAGALMNHLGKLLGNLRARWADERGHEDFEEYRAVIRRNLLDFEATAQVGPITSKPLSILFSLDGEMWKIKSVRSGFVLIEMVAVQSAASAKPSAN